MGEGADHWRDKVGGDAWGACRAESAGEECE